MNKIFDYFKDNNNNSESDDNNPDHDNQLDYKLTKNGTVEKKNDYFSDKNTQVVNLDKVRKTEESYMNFDVKCEPHHQTSKNNTSYIVSHNSNDDKKSFSERSKNISPYIYQCPSNTQGYFS